MRVWALLWVVLVALPLVVAVGALPATGTVDAPVHEHVAGHYVEHGAEETGMANLVTAVLLDYRSFDTFAEVMVIFVAVVAVLSLPRGRTRRHGHSASSGRADAAHAVPVSPVVRFVVKTLSPFIALFAVAMLVRGHEAPGGGFQAAAIVATLFVAVFLVLGGSGMPRPTPSEAEAWLQAAGPLAFALVAWLGWKITGTVLAYPADPSLHLLREGMAFTLELGIAVGGSAILARLFLALQD